MHIIEYQLVVVLQYDYVVIRPKIQHAKRECSVLRTSLLCDSKLIYR